MLIGVPKEIKDNEFRVGLVPSTVRELTGNGHQVVVETNAGVGAGLTDDDYKASGATIAANADDIFGARRHDREGEGAARGRNASCCAAGKSCSPISTSRPIAPRPTIWSSPASPPSPTRR